MTSQSSGAKTAKRITAAEAAGLVRSGHWVDYGFGMGQPDVFDQALGGRVDELAGVKIRNHWRRDAVWGEDRSRTRNPNALANLALLRSALIARLARHRDERSLPELIESFAENPAAAFQLINSL